MSGLWKTHKAPCSATPSQAERLRGGGNRIAAAGPAEGLTAKDTRGTFWGDGMSCLWVALCLHRCPCVSELSITSEGMEPFNGLPILDPEELVTNLKSHHRVPISQGKDGTDADAVLQGSRRKAKA